MLSYRQTTVILFKHVWVLRTDLAGIETTSSTSTSSTASYVVGWFGRWGFGSISLSRPSSRLVDSLGRRLRLTVRVLVGCVAYTEGSSETSKDLARWTCT